MPETWIEALDAYSYPVKLSDYKRSQEFTGFFRFNIAGDRNCTMKFENYFQERASSDIEVWFEVVYWKLYSQPNHRKVTTDRIVDAVLRNGITAHQLHSAVYKYINEPGIANLQRIRDLLGLRSKVLAVALTLPALLEPESLPMVDTQIARWVKENAEPFSRARRYKLQKFNMGGTSLQDDDFANYMTWVFWCREMAGVLERETGLKWRPRDVEMAVFTSQRNKMNLNPIV